MLMKILTGKQTGVHIFYPNLRTEIEVIWEFVPFEVIMHPHFKHLRKAFHFMHTKKMNLVWDWESKQFTLHSFITPIKTSETKKKIDTELMSFEKLLKSTGQFSIQKQFKIFV